MFFAASPFTNDSRSEASFWSPGPEGKTYETDSRMIKYRDLIFTFHSDTFAKHVCVEGVVLLKVEFFNELS